MIGELNRLREEREAAALVAAKKEKSNARRMWWSLRLFVFWPLCYLGLRLIYWIGWQAGNLAGCFLHK